VALVPVLIIASTLATVGVLGFGSSSGVSKEQVRREVAKLLDGIPQSRATLGFPNAPITVWVYADLQCPTVKLFVENYLPSIIGTWVRTGLVRLDYRSLETDTYDEEVFFKQETAALAAGRQDRMWNFVLTFVRQQGEPRTDYVTEEFLADIASQIPGLEMAKWHRNRDDALLSKQVALGVYSGRSRELRSTPSVLIGFTEGDEDRRADRASTMKEVAASLASDIESLRLEASEDFPAIRTVGSSVIGG
jgi:protein-disulfide isomerase